MEGTLSFSGEPVKFEQSPRPLHWVIRSSNLEKSVQLMTLLGARVLRHEEFSEGCEAACNGPYAGAWSKTMVGWDNEDNSYVFELAFNYGQSVYRRGNDLKALRMHQFNKDGDDILKLLKEGMADDITEADDGTLRLINDDFVFNFENSTATGVQLIKGVSINVTDVEESLRFWQKIGLTKLSDNSVVCSGFDNFELDFTKVESVDRGEAFGRLAFSCSDTDVQTVHDNSGAKVQVAPVTLPTEGKADVVVTILETPDSQEICFVNDKGFRDLSQETNEQLDWESYRKKTGAMDKHRAKMERIAAKKAAREAEAAAKAQ